jgi:hypothetical protein
VWTVELRELIVLQIRVTFWACPCDLAGCQSNSLRGGQLSGLLLIANASPVMQAAHDIDAC